MDFDDFHPLPSPGHLRNRNDLGKRGTRERKLTEGIGGLDMVRMFKRLVRGGGRQRVVGLWIY
jgi:hypothetical protein